MNKVSIGCLAVAMLTATALGEVPSVTWRVRACPDGAKSAPRLWQGVSPVVKRWECGERDATFRRLGLSAAPVFLLGANESRECEAAILSRGYAVVRGEVGDFGEIASNPKFDATRVAVVASGDDAPSILRDVARDERLAMVVVDLSKCKAADVTDLLRLVAPRLVYGIGVEESAWQATTEFFKAYGIPERIARGNTLNWTSILDFADQHLKAPSDADSDEIDRRLASACADKTRQVTLGRNPQSTDGVWRITRAIVIPNDFTLILDGCRVELVDRTQDNIIRNAGAVEGATRPNHGLRIFGRNGAVLSAGTRNHYRPARSGDPNGWRAVGILLCDVSDYEIGGFAMEETQCWAISQERCHHGHLHDIKFGSSDCFYNQDGIDFRKGCHDVLVENITGCTGDDVVALTAYRDPKNQPVRYGMQIGSNSDFGEKDDVYNITIRNVHARSSGGHGVIRLLVCDGIKMHHIAVSNVVDTAKGSEKRPFATIRIGDTHFHRTRPCQMGEMHHITVKDVVASGKVAVWVKGPICDSSITGITPIKGGKRYDVTAPMERTILDSEVTR